MTKIIIRKMYCPNCKEEFEAPVVLSTNSYMLERSPEMKKRYEEGTLFKNKCPKCHGELVNNKEEK